MPLPASRRDKNNRRSTASHDSPALGAAVFLNRTHDYDFRRHLITTEYYGISRLGYKKRLNSARNISSNYIPSGHQHIAMTSPSPPDAR